MKELSPQDPEELVQELEQEDGRQKMASKDVEELLHVLQHGHPSAKRWDAAERLGKVETSSVRVVRALVTAGKSDPFPEVRKAAANSLLGPAHQAFLARQPDLRQAVERDIPQAAGTPDAERGSQSGQWAGLIASVAGSSVAGVAVGWWIGSWQAEQSLSHGGGVACGAGFLYALAAGAAAGAVVAGVLGRVGKGRKARIANIVIGAILAAVIAALLWFPVVILYSL